MMFVTNKPRWIKNSNVRSFNETEMKLKWHEATVHKPGKWNWKYKQGEG